MTIPRTSIYDKILSTMNRLSKKKKQRQKKRVPVFMSTRSTRPYLAKSLSNSDCRVSQSKLPQNTGLILPNPAAQRTPAILQQVTHKKYSKKWQEKIKKCSNQERKHQIDLQRKNKEIKTSERIYDATIGEDEKVENPRNPNLEEENRWDGVLQRVSVNKRVCGLNPINFFCPHPRTNY